MNRIKSIKTMKHIALISIICLFAGMVYAQIATNEQPYGLQAGKKVQQQNSVVLSPPDRARIAAEDSINDRAFGSLRYAYPIHVNYTLENSGAWQQLKDGSKLWRLKVNIPDALSTNTYYDAFWLPEGSKFFVYSEETGQSIGAITSEYIAGNRDKPIKFATALIHGENVVYEYYQPASVVDTPIISISRIDYGYRYVNNPYQGGLRGFGDSDPLNININCPEGANWQIEKHAVARVSVSGPLGSTWCSGALINNTKNDYTPYFLTAWHCIREVGLDAIDNNDASQWIFYWDYEHPDCYNSPIEPAHKTTVGATIVANFDPNRLAHSTDFALLLLHQDPRNVVGFSPYYLGWDRSGNTGIVRLLWSDNLVGINQHGQYFLYANIFYIRHISYSNATNQHL